ncbi:MAG: reverse transcriptase family protein [Spirosomataceae bacterium]
MANLNDPQMLFKLKAKLFCKINSTEKLASLFDSSVDFLLEIAEKPFYNEFKIPKKYGDGFRYIEDPEDSLKSILRILNEYLQVVYFGVRSEAAYGFLISPPFDIAPRNIRSNAQRHCSNEWMLNADFRDFFHQIKYQEVHDIFSCPPFNFSDEIATILTKLTTYKGRLPMGSPTSPVLSNFATLLLDQDLTKLSNQQAWVYTRFADDLTFSSHKPIGIEDFQKIEYVCTGYGLEFNPSKIRFIPPHEPKVVTGLVVTDGVDIPSEYYKSLKKEIEKLRTVLQIHFRNGSQPTKWLTTYQQQIEGGIEFIKQIKTADSPNYKNIRRMYDKTLQETEQYEPIGWIEFGYLDFI